MSAVLANLSSQMYCSLHHIPEHSRKSVSFKAHLASHLQHGQHLVLHHAKSAVSVNAVQPLCGCLSLLSLNKICLLNRLHSVGKLCLVSFRERADAAASLRQAKAEPNTALSLLPQGQQSAQLALATMPAESALSASIDDLVAALKPRRGSAEGLVSEDSSTLSASKALTESCV